MAWLCRTGNAIADTRLPDPRVVGIGDKILQTPETCRLSPRVVTDDTEIGDTIHELRKLVVHLAYWEVVRHGE